MWQDLVRLCCDVCDTGVTAAFYHIFYSSRAIFIAVLRCRGIFIAVLLCRRYFHRGITVPTVTYRGLTVSSTSYFDL